jgi:hypothetical protein
VSVVAVAPVVLVDSLVAPIVLLLELRVGSVLVESGEVLAVELVLPGVLVVLVLVSVAVVLDGYVLLRGYVLLELSDVDGYVLLVPGVVLLPYVPVELEVLLVPGLDVGSVDAVVFRLPLVFSFVVLGLVLELVLP